MLLRDVKLVLDSGAFTAWTKGAEINIQAYIQFCLEHQDVFTYFVNLDVLPGAPGVMPTRQMVEESAQQGWENFWTMIRGGLPKERVIHVFHQGEDFKWLTKMIKRIPYIGLSPANDRVTKEKMGWLDECMKYGTDAEGYPLAKFHGFAVTALPLMVRYPWFSVDSASWAHMSRRGTIILPTLSGGEYDYLQSPWVIGASSRSPFQERPSQHISTLTPREKEIALDYIDSLGLKVGSSTFRTVTLPYELQKEEMWGGKKREDGTREVETVVEVGLCNSIDMRDHMNITFFLRAVDRLPEWPWPFRDTTRKTSFEL